MTEEEFTKLINRDESELLDFKRCHYNFESKNDEDAKFIKDIISFTNTIRESPSFIILGIEENEGLKELCGIDNHIDESILQNKIKDKVRPIPKFNYHLVDYQNKKFGIIEIPVNRYSTPVMPVIRMKGLEVSKVYFRRGSSNSEANHAEVIDINNWITTVVPNHKIKEINESISNLISDISTNEYYSPFLPKVIEIGKIIQNTELVIFGTNELMGWKSDINDASNHRSTKSLVSFNQFKNARHLYGTPLSVIWNDLENSGDFTRYDMKLADPVGQIEHSIKKHRQGAGNLFTIIKIKASDLPEVKDIKNGNIEMFAHINENDVAFMYSNSKQRLIELLTLSLI